MDKVRPESQGEHTLVSGTVVFPAKSFRSGLGERPDHYAC